MFMEKFKQHRFAIIASVVAVVVISALTTVGVLFFLSDSSAGQILRAKLGIDEGKGLTISTTKVDKIIVEESSAIIDANKKVGPAVVSVLTTGKPVVDFFTGQSRLQQASGTGFIITSDGLIATNRHVVSGGEKFTVTTADEKTFEGRVVATDPSNDLALMKIEAKGLPVADLGDSDRIEVGQWVVAIGNALGELQNTLTAGVISAKERTVTPSDGQGQTQELYGMLQTDAAINPGNSGGPLVNLAGQVVGINSAVAQSGQNIGFAIPVNDLKKDLESYNKNGKIVQPYIGVRYQTLTKALAESYKLSVSEGAWLAPRVGENSVVAGSPAAKAGLKDGDIITALNGKKLTADEPLARQIRQFSPGDRVSLSILRGDTKLTLLVTLGTFSG
ncbi:hypothetical protein A3A71_01390 [Candidatus Berkelbacteria bacterium RIFCSPLOWO2_01_FULL_50_28]|uniref:PDZ domain-containing protein n=1 Tax=Candidatus Berkelbacteria bacterium RIFCSPLOWO2_01_FULL_50_28 TaxID=1797471 RepID=A0A1F5EBG5_9BACT|nr:MAG: hypothetical protein A2807_01960 [Candidatus Berkelbacteria bacterium RIFCSPHIGHO2_01_FULL_50_36]OGD64691.1 MAG: hypothetical protein A3A71_01390 [Candidatus Berkelbacteria bacterium RIFCSPLOWO2_01_FULL_50_28]